MRTPIIAILALILAAPVFGDEQSVTTLLLRRDVKIGEKLDARMVYEVPFALKSDINIPLTIDDLTKNWILTTSLKDYTGKPFIRAAAAHQTLHIGMFEKGEFPELDVVADEHEEDEPRVLSEEFTSPITFRFLDEMGDPIQGTFTLHQYKNGKYFENWHRYLPLNERGEITIKEFPPEFQFGGSSNDDFYHYWIRSTELDPTKDTFVHRSQPTGAMKFEITKFPQKYHDSLVVRYWKHKPEGSLERVKGIGIFPDDPEHTIGGLDPGTYHIEIKFNYEDEKPIFESEPFKVETKKYTSLPKIEISEAAIEAAKR